MNRRRLRQRIINEVNLIREMSERLTDIADHLEDTAKALHVRPISTSRDYVYAEAGGVGSLKPQEIAVRLERISEDMTPNMDQMTNSRYNPYDYE